VKFIHLIVILAFIAKPSWNTTIRISALYCVYKRKSEDVFIPHLSQQYFVSVFPLRVVYQDGIILFKHYPSLPYCFINFNMTYYFIICYMWFRTKNKFSNLLRNCKYYHQLHKVSYLQNICLYFLFWHQSGR
jgi:hypothetical protein